MLGSALGRATHAHPPSSGGYTSLPRDVAAAAAAAAEEEAGQSGECGETEDAGGAYPPPMYNPRTAWVGDERTMESSTPQHTESVSMSPQHNAPPSGMGPRTTQDMLDLEEENRVLRREVARLQQLNEARRKQLSDMQTRMDEGDHSQHYRDPSEVRGHPTQRQSLGSTRQSPPRSSSTPPGSPRGGDRASRLEVLVQRWKQKAFSWEERYSHLWNEISKAETSAGATAALQAVASIGKTGIQEMVDLEEAFDMVKGELVKAKDFIGKHANALRSSRSSVAMSQTSPERFQQRSPRREMQAQAVPVVSEREKEREVVPVGNPDVCHQCADYRYRLASLGDQLADAEAAKLFEQKRAEALVPSFPFLSAIPGLEALDASLRLALHGRDAAASMAQMSLEYFDEYLMVLREASLPAPPAVCTPPPSAETEDSPLAATATETQTQMTSVSRRSTMPSQGEQTLQGTHTFTQDDIASEGPTLGGTTGYYMPPAGSLGTASITNPASQTSQLHSVTPLADVLKAHTSYSSYAKSSVEVEDDDDEQMYAP